MLCRREACGARVQISSEDLETCVLLSIMVLWHCRRCFAPSYGKGPPGNPSHGDPELGDQLCV